MKRVIISIETCYPYKPGDEFCSNGDPAVDAVDLCLIYELTEIAMVRTSLHFLEEAMVLKSKALHYCFFSAHSLADIQLYNKFLLDCQSAIEMRNLCRD